MNQTRIEWADATWNPITGCTPVSIGCEHCYAARMAKRLAGRFGYPKDDPFRVTFHPDRLAEPLHWEKPRKIFVCSMGDLFHEDVDPERIDRIFKIMDRTPQHIYLLLTKRAARMNLYMGSRARMAKRDGGQWPPRNVWLGVTAENQRTADGRIPQLLDTPAALRFVSVEPMLGPVDLRQYIGYNGSHETDIRDRGICLPSRVERCPGNTQGRVDMESGRRTREQMEQRYQETDHYPKKDRQCEMRWVSPCKNNESKETSNDRGAPIGMETLSGKNSGGAYDQSQEWCAGRQPTEEFRASNLFNATDTLYTRSKNGSCGSSERGEKLQGETDKEGCSGDTLFPKRNREEKENEARAQDFGISKRARCFVSDNLGCSSAAPVGLALIICGAETGPGARPMDYDWGRELRDECQSVNIPFFFKKGNGGKEPPIDLLVREWPQVMNNATKNG